MKSTPSIASFEDLLEAIKRDYQDLSPQLQSIASLVEKSREKLALMGIQEVAKDCAVQPSAVVRFAKRFGFSGFSALQSLFKAQAHQQLSAGSDYQGRIQNLIDLKKVPLSSTRLAREVIAASMEGLHELEHTLSETGFETSVELLAHAPAIWLVAARRSFSVAAYLAYALQQTSKPVQWVNGIGLMQHGQLNALQKNDVMLAISFAPYAKETLEAIETAKARQAKIIVLTDSLFSPVTQLADVSLLVQDGSVSGFRTLTSTLCLAQSLFMATALKIEQQSPGAKKTRPAKRKKN
jgi:DNA-binding MurR/RpiR family transcriptional regulator